MVFFFALSVLSSLSFSSPLVLSRIAVQLYANVFFFRKPHLQEKRSSASCCGLCNSGTCAMLLGFVKLHLAALPFVIVAHAGPVCQSAPKLAESSALLLGSGVADGGLDLVLVFVFILILLFLVAVCD